jgi:hypothetical protein
MLPDITLSVTVPHTLSLPDQVYHHPQSLTLRQRIAVLAGGGFTMHSAVQWDISSDDKYQNIFLIFINVTIFFIPA